MPDWATFAVFTGVVLMALLLLARASQGAVPDADATGEPPHRLGAAGEEPPNNRPTHGERESAHVASDGFVYPLAESRERENGLGGLSTGALLANVAVSHGVFAALLLAGAWYTGVTPAMLGVSPATAGGEELLLGVGLGLALYAANEVGATMGRRIGLGGGEALREALAPDSTGGWVLLLFGVLPIIAGFEELLFRGVLVGALGLALEVSPWLLAAASSIPFALGHGAQGWTGILVTGLLGFALAAGFVLTGSLLLVVVAHYVVNAMEFVVHELVGAPWTDRAATTDRRSGSG